jgi:hypothetical protein
MRRAEADETSETVGAVEAGAVEAGAVEASLVSIVCPTDTAIEGTEPIEPIHES